MGHNSTWLAALITDDQWKLWESARWKNCFSTFLCKFGWSKIRICKFLLWKKYEKKIYSQIILSDTLEIIYVNILNLSLYWITGESGLGKSTLINSLFLTDLYPERIIPGAAGKYIFAQWFLELIAFIFEFW